jgi:predicted PurR-regulated permease PerM
VTVCLVNGVLSFVGFAIFVPDYAFVLALVAGVLSFIPVLGSIISSIPAVLVGLAVSLHTALMVLLWILGIHFLEAYILNPKIISREARLHPVITILAVVAGERVFGIPGAFLAVPTAAVLKALITFAYRRYAGVTAS